MYVCMYVCMYVYTITNSYNSHYPCNSRTVSCEMVSLDSIGPTEVAEAAAAVLGGYLLAQFAVYWCGHRNVLSFPLPTTWTVFIPFLSLPPSLIHSLTITLIVLFPSRAGECSMCPRGSSRASPPDPKVSNSFCLCMCVCVHT